MMGKVGQLVDSETDGHCGVKIRTCDAANYLDTRKLGSGWVWLISLCRVVQCVSALICSFAATAFLSIDYFVR